MKFFLTINTLLLLLTMPMGVVAQLQIKMMSYNIRLDVASDGENRWDARKDKVASLMNYYEPDFIGGQEVQYHQLQYLKENLNGYAVIGVGRDDGKEAGEYSCIFYKQQKYELLQQSTFWLSPTPDSVSIGWNAACKRVCTYGLFKNNKTKQQFWVFNTHFDHISKLARIESARLIFDKIQAINKNNDPVILSGDFNSLPEDAPAQYLSNAMQNSRSISKQTYGPLDTWNAFKFNAKLDGCIDYVFVSKNKKLSVVKFATLTDSYDMKYPSDHLPILATIIIKK